MTQCLCIGRCNSLNYTLAGAGYNGLVISITEHRSFSRNFTFYRDRCYCSDSPGNMVDNATCNTACKGDNTQICGGGTKHLSLFGTGR